MSTKITKSDLKMLIKEALREELAISRRPSTKIKEALITDVNVPEAAYAILTKNKKFLDLDENAMRLVERDMLRYVSPLFVNSNLGIMTLLYNGAGANYPGARIVKITNFREAYLDGAAPNYTAVAPIM